MADPIIFLDIDGVMIPETQILINRMSAHERIFPPTTIAAINELCKRSGAKIVFNTSHNNPLPNAPDIEIAIVNHGLHAEYIHPTDPKTSYPSLSRDKAIVDWLHRHPEIDDDRWIVFDDVVCADREHMIVVNPSGGVDVNNINQALMLLGGGLICIFI